ncbi:MULTISPECIES: hypothetical protein [unclassified Bradyrhizobium]
MLQAATGAQVDPTKGTLGGFDDVRIEQRIGGNLPREQGRNAIETDQRLDVFWSERNHVRRIAPDCVAVDVARPQS